MKPLEGFEPFKVYEAIRVLQEVEMVNYNGLSELLGVATVTISALMHPKEKHRYSVEIKRRVVEKINQWIKIREDKNVGQP